MSSHPFLHRFTVTAADVEPFDVWELYDDVSSWPRWDAGLERIERDRPLGAGARGTMLLKGAPEPMAFAVDTVDGPAEAAQQVGAMVCSDFPEAMDTLLALARERRAGTP